MMKHINLRVDEALDAEITRIAQENGKKKSDIYRVCIEMAFDTKLTISRTETDETLEVSKKFFLRLNDNEHETLKNAAQHNNVSMNTEIRNRLKATLTNSPHLTLPELHAVRENSIALSRIGTNINVISRALNEGRLIPGDQDFFSLLQNVKEQIAQAIKNNEALRSACTNRYLYTVK